MVYMISSMTSFSKLKYIYKLWTQYSKLSSNLSDPLCCHSLLPILCDVLTILCSVVHYQVPKCNLLISDLLPVVHSIDPISPGSFTTKLYLLFRFQIKMHSFPGEWENSAPRVIYSTHYNWLYVYILLMYMSYLLGKASNFFGVSPFT